MPISPDVYNPVLKELEEYGVKFTEKDFAPSAKEVKLQ